MQTSQEDPLKRTCIARDQYSCWYDHVLFPAIAAAVRDPNILQYIPKNLNISQTNSRVRQEGISTERLSDMNAEFGILGQGRRSTSLSYVLQNRHLEAIWEGVRTRAATYPLFAGIKLYLGAKNLKLVYMNADIRQTIRAWRSQWQIAVDQVFLDPSDTYVDIGRQYTPRIGSVAEANVLMWQRCRLKQLWRQRQVWSSQYNAMYPFVRSSLEDIATSESRSVPLRLIEYPRFTLRDTIDMTIQPADKSREVGEGLIYSQFYNLVKIPFDAAKQYPFQNRQLEKMALDPSYVADYERSTRGSHANQASLSLAYRLSKLRSKQVTSQSGQRQSSEVEREGLGLNRTSKDYGLGWWLPGKFNWDEWRFRGDVNERLVAGNSLLHIEYGRQWKVIKDIRDVHARMWQANKWVKQYSVRKSQRNRNIWFEYLSNTVIELFQSEVWRAARKSLDWKSGSDLTDEAAASYPADQPPPYCYDALASSFHDRRRNVNHTRPYFLTGNKIRSSSVWDLVCDHLGFNLHDGRLESRDGLQPLHHRIAVRRSVEMISDVLGHTERFGASGWTEDCDPSEPRFHWTSEDLLQYVGGTVTIGSFKIGRAVQSGSRKGFIYPLAERGRPPVLRLTDRIRGPAAQSLGFRYLQLLARKRPRTAEERERLRRHFRRRDCVRVSKVVVGTDSIHSDDTGSSAQTEETDQLWRPQKRLRKAVRDQMIVRLE
ncbi:hypothetical protein FOFC_07735 [Fusarium oxysporum]|nr:hypothetical protein FOFC_07735 [Fusarium oxysporum]